MDVDIGSVAAVDHFLRRRLTETLPGGEAQRRFAPRPPRKGWEPGLVPPGERHAAALVLVYPGAAGPSIPLTVRQASLPHHGGQVSLPGGQIDPGEPPLDAALRETYEEIGLAPGAVQIIGALSSFWVIVSGFVVFPFVGIVDRAPTFALATREVAELIELPLTRFFDRTARGWDVRVRDGVTVRFPYIDAGHHRVWGATAMILSEFGALFDPAFSPPDPPS